MAQQVGNERVVEFVNAQDFVAEPLAQADGLRGCAKRVSIVATYSQGMIKECFEQHY